MNALGLTSLVIAFVAAVGGPLATWLIWRRTKRDSNSERAALADAQDNRTAASTWRDINSALNQDRNQLREQLEETQRQNSRVLEETRQQHTQEIRDLRSEYDAKLAQRDTRIKDLEQQVESLYRRLVLKDSPGP